MKLHHMCLVTTDLEQSIKFWTTILGFRLQVKAELPDGSDSRPNALCTPTLLNDAFGCKNARSRMAVLTSEDDGTFIEIQEPINPRAKATPRDKLKYRDTGIRELGLLVTNIDEMFEKVRAEGLVTQTDYVWPAPPNSRSFIFYDYDGNMIQLWQSS